MVIRFHLNNSKPTERILAHKLLSYWDKYSCVRAQCEAFDLKLPLEKFADDRVWLSTCRYSLLKAVENTAMWFQTNDPTAN